MPADPALPPLPPPPSPPPPHSVWRLLVSVAFEGGAAFLLCYAAQAINAAKRVFRHSGGGGGGGGGGGTSGASGTSGTSGASGAGGGISYVGLVGFVALLVLLRGAASDWALASKWMTGAGRGGAWAVDAQAARVAAAYRTSAANVADSECALLVWLLAIVLRDVLPLGALPLPVLLPFAIGCCCCCCCCCCCNCWHRRCRRRCCDAPAHACNTALFATADQGASGPRHMHNLRIPASLVACAAIASVAIFSAVWTRVVGVHSTRHVRSFSFSLAFVQEAVGSGASGSWGTLEVSHAAGVHMCLVAVAVATLHVVEATTARCQRLAATQLRKSSGEQMSKMKLKTQ